MQRRWTNGLILYMDKEMMVFTCNPKLNISVQLYFLKVVSSTSSQIIALEVYSFSEASELQSDWDWLDEGFTNRLLFVSQAGITNHMTNHSPRSLMGRSLVKCLVIFSPAGITTTFCHSSSHRLGNFSGNWNQNNNTKILTSPPPAIQRYPLQYFKMVTPFVFSADSIPVIVNL